MATVANTAPSSSISKMAGKATLAISPPSVVEAATYCDTSSSATDDIGDIAQPSHKACFQLAPLPTLPSPTPAILASMRAPISASTKTATGPCQSACAATTVTSTNISMVSMDDAVPICRGQD